MVWMMAAAAAAQVGSGLLGKRSAEKKAKSAAKQQIKLTGLQRAEEARMRQSAARIERGTAVAGIGASNILQSGSAQRYLRSMDFQAMREEAVAKEAWRLEKRAIRKGAQGVGDSILYGSIASAASTALSAWGNTPTGGDPGGGGGGGPVFGAKTDSYMKSIGAF